MNNNLQQAKEANKRSGYNKNPKTSSNKGLNNSISDTNPKNTNSLNIQSTGNDFYTGISNDDMSSISSIDNCTNDSITQERKSLINYSAKVNKSTHDK